MGNIIKELLLLAQVRKTEVRQEPLKMGEIVSESQQRLIHMIEEYNTEIVVPTDWPTAIGYGPWIEEVWVNYLSNAIKYGGQPPRLELGAHVQVDGMIRFWVRDNGAGLTPKEQAKLFTPFTRLDHMRVKGHGLGLSIVQQIMGKLGGQVSVESEGKPGRGSIFSFTLRGVVNSTCPPAEQE
jgi:signal transduction histidine kinase